MNELADSPINKTRLSPTPSLPIITRLPAWLQHGKKVTYDHNGEFHKSFIQITTDGTARFSCRRQKSSKTEFWGVALPNLVAEWPSLNCDHILQPTWNVSSFLRPSTADDPPNASFISRGVDTATAEAICASHVSARNLQAPCPPSLSKTLHEDFVDHSTWHESYMEEKEGLIST